jgi:hypothetical protein
MADKDLDSTEDAVGEVSAPESPSPRRQGVLLGIVLLLIVGGFSVVGYTAYREKARRTARAEADREAMKPPPGPVGSPEAKLKVEACCGHCISDIMDKLATVAEAYPDQIRAEFYAYESPEGQEFLHERGESLASVFFNGENTFTIGDGDEKRELRFVGPPGSESYQLDDLRTVLRLEFEEIYGNVPDDFDEKTDGLR